MNNLSNNPFNGKQIPNSNGMNPMEQQMTQLLQRVKQSGNPQQAINNLLQRNPQFAQFMQGIQNPQQYVMQNLSKSGIDINKIMRNL